MLKQISAALLVSLGAVTSVTAVLYGQQRPTRPERVGAPIRLKATTFTPTRGELPAIRADLTIPGHALDERGYYLVQFEGPILEAWKVAVSALGAEILEYVPDFAFKVHMNPGQANQVERLAPVVWVGLFHPGYKLGPDLARNGTQAYAVRIERGANMTGAAAAIVATGAQILRREGSLFRVSADSAQLDAIARVLDVAAVENFLPFQKHNEYGGGVILGASLANESGFDGSTQTIAIADTGLGNGTAADAHVDVPPSRIATIFNWPGSADSCFASIVNDGAVDVDSGHGTHTVTTALGAGGPAGEGRGTAPGATLVFQAVENWATTSLLCYLFYGLTDGYYLVGIPSDIRQLFQQSYDAGARIHSDSWGSSVAGAYTLDSVDADDFVWNHPDMTITFSAGNAGIDANADGSIDADSINSPATAKNVISVGASENDRQSHWECDTNLTYTTCAAEGGQNSIFTYGASWPGYYPANPIKDDASAGNRDQMAAFSSRGPTDDGRIKPDVVAPGTWVLSGYSDRFQQQYDPSSNPQDGLYQYDGWGNPLNQYYKYMGGTSMSNPLVAGAAAAVRDFYEKTAAHNASAALVKATVINSAVDLLDENNDGVNDNAYPIPNNHEGWGRVDLANATDGSHEFVDETTGLSTGGSATFTFPVSGAGWPFKVTLAWSDYPSTSSATKNLVNDLDLTLTAPDGATYAGNVFAGGWSQTGGSADRTNNLENVFVLSAMAGTWTVEVRGFNIPNGPQPFALVVDGQFDGPGSSIPRVTVAAADAVATESGPTTGAFTVAHTGDTAASLIVHYTVTGTATAGTDYVTLSGSVTIDAGSSEATLEIVPVDDATVESDETVVVTLSADPTYSLGSPGAASVTIVSDDVPPDLIVSSLTAPVTGGAGTTITVTDTTKNQGSGASEASETGFYLSANTLLDGSDVFLDSRPVAPLSSGGTETASTTLLIPAETSSGTYYLLATADVNHTITETQEGNNTKASASISIGPDLIVSAVTAPTLAGAGDTIVVSDTTKNVGGDSSPVSTTAFYLSTNGLLDAADVLLGSRPVPLLASGTLDTASTSLTIPMSTTAGTYYIVAKADGSSTVVETNENNNLKISSGLKVGADLIVSALTAPATAGAGDATTVNDTTKNQGSGVAPATVTGFYLSANTVLDAADVLLGSRSVPSLASGATDPASTSLTIPPATVTGTYYILAKADENGAVVETLENNNVKNSFTVKIGPDLTISALTGPATAAAGGTIVVTDATKNQGGGLAAVSLTTFYLSTNTILDAADVLLGSRSVPSLASATTNSASTSLTIPGSVAGGSYYVLAKADGDMTVAETVETNNGGPTFLLKIGPDLTVSVLTVPATAGAGDTIVVTETTKNQGYGPAPASVTGFYLSPNAALDSADVLLGSRSVSSLAVGATESASTSLIIPPSTAPGLFYVFAKADLNQTVSEVLESNNTRFSSVRIGPDLAVSAFTTPLTAVAGSTITVNDTTKNQGGGLAGTSATWFFLSTNSIFDAADVFLGSRVVPDLSAGMTAAAATALAIAPATSPGTYFVIAKADGSGAVVETQETNNTRVTSIRIDPAP